MTKLEQAARELADAANRMRVAVNELFLARNPDDALAMTAGPPMSIEDAQELQSNAFLTLEKAECRIRRILGIGEPPSVMAPIYARVAAYRAAEQGQRSSYGL